MTQQPLFSILIANYNNGCYLQEAIDSVTSQTYTHWEIVIVDDGSTDESNTIYAHYAEDPRFHIHYNGTNQGCGYTKRRCAELATGNLCGFLDPDDTLLPDALQVHVEAHLAHPDCSTVFSRFYKCSEKLAILSESRMLTIPNGESYFTHHDYRPEVLASFKTTCYKRTIGIDASLPAAVDQDLYFKLEEVAPVFVLDHVTYNYRSTPNQISQGDNEYKTLYWNLYVRHQTCLRRGLDPSQYPARDMTMRMNKMADRLKCYQQSYEELSTSNAYRLGKALLHPFSLIRRKLHR